MTIDFTKAYNQHYHEQHIKNWINFTELREDNPNQIFYPENAWIWAIKRKIALALMDSHINVIWRWSIERNYEEEMTNFFQQLRKRSIIIITNHITFGNFPIIIIELRKWAKKLKIDFDFDINTILGPALTTSIQCNSIWTISNLIKTIPTTWNSEIPWFKEDIQKIRQDFKNYLFGMAKQTKNVFLLAPTGTRDFTLLENNEAKWVFFEGDKRLRHTIWMIKILLEQDVWICMMWVNESAIKLWEDKDWNTILTRDNNWWYWNIMVWMECLSKNTVEKLIDKRIFMERLAANVLDQNWIQIWITCDHKMVNAYKKWTSLPNPVHIPNLKKWNPYIENKFLEALIHSWKRKLFELLK